MGEPIIKSQYSLFDPTLLSTSYEIFMFDLMYHPMFLVALSTLRRSPFIYRHRRNTSDWHTTPRNLKSGFNV